MKTGFRPEIAGLRAIAVVSVVLFHLKIAGFEGGFIGVDVFFVISGYLITRIILMDLDSDRFQFGSFYVRRMRRIFPALIFTVVLTYVAGALWCSALMFLDVARESTNALLWISNIQYWRESHQYFAHDSDELALLHCWSLTVEEQFYLIWPLFIVVAHRFGRVFEAVAVAVAASLLSSIVITQSDPSVTFFLMPFRIYEFGCGILVIYLDRKVTLNKVAAEGLSAAGVISILASVLSFRAEMTHMDVAALLPCLGAASTIWAGTGTRIARLITNPVMLGIGAISYSLYLCHWPIIFFARFIFAGGADTVAGMLGQIVAMLLLATGMYYFVERHFILPREARSESLTRTATAFWAVILPLAALTHTTYLTKGFPWRLPRSQLELARLQDFPRNEDLSPIGRPTGVLFVGDSILIQYMYGLTPTMKELGIGYEGRGGAGCPILYGVALSRSVRRNECVGRRDETLAWLEQRGQPIIYAQLWRQYDDRTIDYEFEPSPKSLENRSYYKLQAALELTIGKIVARGNRVLLVGDQVDPGCAINLARIEQGPLPRAAQSCPPVPRQAAERAAAPVDAMLARVQAKWPAQVTLIRTTEYFCDDSCPVVKDDLWLFSNRDHLNKAGSKYMIGRSESAFKTFLLGNTNE